MVRLLPTSLKCRWPFPLAWRKTSLAALYRAKAGWHTTLASIEYRKKCPKFAVSKLVNRTKRIHRTKRYMDVTYESAPMERPIEYHEELRTETVSVSDWVVVRDGDNNRVEEVVKSQSGRSNGRGGGRDADREGRALRYCHVSVQFSPPGSMALLLTIWRPKLPGFTERNKQLATMMSISRPRRREPHGSNSQQ